MRSDSGTKKGENLVKRVYKHVVSRVGYIYIRREVIE
jgi:hypothetical protein